MLPVDRIRVEPISPGHPAALSGDLWVWGEVGDQHQIRTLPGVLLVQGGEDADNFPLTISIDRRYPVERVVRAIYEAFGVTGAPARRAIRITMASSDGTRLFLWATGGQEMVSDLARAMGGAVVLEGEPGPAGSIVVWVDPAVGMGRVLAEIDRVNEEIAQRQEQY